METFSNLPTPMKVGAGGAGVVVLGGTAWWLQSGGLWIFLIVLIILLALAIGGFYLWKNWSGKRRSAQMGDDLLQHSAASPKSISDPGKRAKLDDLRRRFEEGVAEYRSRGRDVNMLPWYVFVGPPGSGKTEAIRHSNLSFPPGLNKELQGVGGTLNMHWWFTNHGVILDTAGRLMFEEVAPGESSEWREFLSLLKKHRPLCPINGLLLTIGVDSLIRESADEIAKKAGKIAQQIDVIQRTLDIRFPVYVIVTKCDLLTGFREFFDELTDPQLQHQMFGWSNPDPLDSPFRPELIDQYLTQVTQKLRRRCLGALRDPVPVDSANRRIDEVDSIYALPNSVSLIGARLRRYLETIFVAGVWSSKPLFLRGIYFTSSMREGGDLDQALAQALKINVDELPQGRVWDKERAFFLRDLFTERVFRESGLVTRATNVSQMLRRRQATLYGFGLAALLLFGVFSFVGMKGLERSISDEGEDWARALEMRGQSILATNQSGSLTLNTNLTELNQTLEERVRAPLQVSWIFKPINLVYSMHPRDIETQRRTAQGSFLAETVLQPLLERTRAGMRDMTIAEEKMGAVEALRHAQALRTLIWLESQAAGLQDGQTPPLTPELARQRLLLPLMDYAMGGAPTNSAQFTNLLATTTGSFSGDRAAGWPPAFLSAGADLESNSAIDQGISRLGRLAANPGTEAQSKKQAMIRSAKALIEFQDAEEALRKTMAQWPDSIETPMRRLEAAYAEVRASAQELPNGSLMQSYTNYITARQSTLQPMRDIEQQVSEVKTVCRPIPLFDQVLARLQSARAEATAQIEQEFSEQEIQGMVLLDNRYLSGLNYSNYWSFYREAGELAKRDIESYGVGAYAGYNRWLGECDAARQRLTQPQAEDVGLTECVQTARSVLDWAFLRKCDQLVRTARFPLSGWSGAMTGQRMNPQQVLEAQRFLKMTLEDLDSLHTPLDQVAAGEQLKRTLLTLKEITDGLIDGDGQVRDCRVRLPSAQTTSWSRVYRNIRLNEGNFERADDPNRLLGEIRVSEPLRIQLASLFQGDYLVGRTFSLGDWGPIEMLLRFRGERGADGKWLVTCPLPDSEGDLTPSDPDWQNLYVELEIEFVAPLPLPDQWPKPKTN